MEAQHGKAPQVGTEQAEPHVEAPADEAGVTQGETLEELVGDSTRGMLAVHGRDGITVLPTAFWSDGTALWLSSPASSQGVTALLRRPDCAMYVPPRGDGERGALLHGRARVFGPNDPLGLILHGATVSTAMAALAVRNAPSIVGYVQDAARVPRRLAPQSRVALKISVQRLRGVQPPQVGPGIAPALPTEIPPDVRRALAGERRAVLARRSGGEELALTPVVWSAGFALTAPRWQDLEDTDHVAVAVAVHAGRRPSETVGLMLRGRLAAGRLQPAHATWWQGFDRGSAEVAPRPAGGLVLPD